MSSGSLYQVKVITGRKAGATRSLPLGDLSIGTTLNVEFFIGCVDLWHQLLRSDSSANSRSATASVDALPEQLMQSVLSHTSAGITLTVQSGFAEIGDKRLLPGGSGTVPLDTTVRIGSSELMVESVTNRGVLRDKPQTLSPAKYHWMNNKLVFIGITAMAVVGLSASVLFKPHKKEASALRFATTTEAVVFDERVVAVVSTSPAFLMTESGQRYDLGQRVHDGYKIVGIDGSNIELQRGNERLRMSF